MSDCGPVVLWTAIPLELVLDPGYGQPPAAVPLQVDGRQIQARPLGDGRAVVQRLISTRPSDYLDARWQPGRVVWLPIP